MNVIVDYGNRAWENDETNDVMIFGIPMIV